MRGREKRERRHILLMVRGHRFVSVYSSYDNSNKMLSVYDKSTHPTHTANEKKNKYVPL